MAFELLPESSSLLSEPNVLRFLDLLSKAEGTDVGGDPYRVGFGGGQFDSTEDHPRAKKGFTQTDGKKNSTSAAGRYQFLEGTWDEIADELGLSDFSGINQDLAAIELIRRNGALDDVVQGDFKSAAGKLGGIWASLPSSPHPQNTKSEGFLDEAIADVKGRYKFELLPDDEEPELVPEEAGLEPRRSTAEENLAEAQARYAPRKESVLEEEGEVDEGVRRLYDSLGALDPQLREGHLRAITERGDEDAPAAREILARASSDSAQRALDPLNKALQDAAVEGGGQEAGGVSRPVDGSFIPTARVYAADDLFKSDSDLRQKDETTARMSGEDISRVLKIAQENEWQKRLDRDAELRKDRDKYARVKDFANENPTVGALFSGLMGLSSSTAAIPAFAATFTNEVFLNPWLKAAGLPELPRVDPPQFLQGMDRMAQAVSPDVLELDPTQAYRRGELREWGFATLASQAPNIAELILAGHLGATANAIYALMALQAGAGSYSAGDEPTTAATRGTFEFVLNRTPVNAVAALERYVGSLSAPARATLARQLAERVILTGATASLGVVTNATQEGLIQVANNSLDKFVGGRTDVGVLDGVYKAIATGGVAGGGFGVSGAKRVGDIRAAGGEAGLELSRALDAGAFPPGSVDAAVRHANRTEGAMVSPTLDAAETLGSIENLQAVAADTAERVAGERRAEQDKALAEIGEAKTVEEAVESFTKATEGGTNESQLLDEALRSAGVDPAEMQAHKASAEQTLAEAQENAAVAEAKAQEAAQTQPQTTERSEPQRRWYGRRGDGYARPEDAQRGLAERRRLDNSHEWTIEQTPEGRYYLAGRALTNLPTPQRTQAGDAGVPTATTGEASAGQESAQPVGSPQTQGAPSGVPARLPASTTDAAVQLSQRLRAWGQQRGDNRTTRVLEVSRENLPDPLRGALAALEAATGTRVAIVRNLNPEVQDFNGLTFRDGLIYVDESAQSPVTTVAAHEFTHNMRRTDGDLYSRLEEEVRRQGLIPEWIEELKRRARGENVDEAMGVEELTADAVGDAMTDPAFLRRLAKQDPSFFRELADKMIAFLDSLMGKAEDLGSSKYMTDVAAFRDVLAEVMQEFSDRGRRAPAQAADAAFSRKPAFPSRRARDGAIRVLGDPEAIRAIMPKGVRGRVVSDGVQFTPSVESRVRAALEGDTYGYSRRGEVRPAEVKGGVYVGAPPKYDNVSSVRTLRKQLLKLAEEGIDGRYWYENSSKAVLQAAGGDVQEARRFVALLSIYSAQARVDSNTTFALRAWAQHKAGLPISVRTEVQDKKAQAAMEDVEEFWSGEKTGNFFINLLTEIDPSTRGRQGATIDIWMMRAAEYPTDVPGAPQYAFMENEINRVAQKLGWEPQQAQAAIWVAIKARMENRTVGDKVDAKSVKKGWVRFEKDAKGKKKRILVDPAAHRKSWIEASLKADASDSELLRSKFDYADALRAHVGQVSWEAIPSTSVGVLEGVHNAPHEQQVEYHNAIKEALLDENGVDQLAAQVGLLLDGNVDGPGVWQSSVVPGGQRLFAMAPNAQKFGRNQLDPGQKSALDLYSAVLGLVLRQDGVGYHRPFYNDAKVRQNGVEIRVGRPLLQEEAQGLWDATNEVSTKAGRPNWEDTTGLISSPEGMRIINFDEGFPNREFQAIIEKVVPATSLTIEELGGFASDGNLVSNNWSENPNGQEYQSYITEAGRPDLLKWARDVLATRIQKINEDFSERYGWGDPGQPFFSRRGERASVVADSEVPSYGQPRPGAVSAVGYHFSRSPRASLDARMYGRGLKGLERKRLEGHPEITPRTFFYVDVGNGIEPEAGVGSYAHKVRLDNLYDPRTRAIVIKSEGKTEQDVANEFEQAVLDQGFDGYLALNVGDNEGHAVLIGEKHRSVPVVQSGYPPMSPTPELIKAPEVATQRVGDVLQRKPKGDQVMQVVRATNDLNVAVPSFEMKWGNVRVHESEVDAFNAIMAEHGSEFRLDESMPVFSRPSTGPVVGQRFTLPEETVGRKGRRVFQDYFIRAKTVVDSILEQGGTVTEDSNFYLAEENMHGRRGGRMLEFQNAHVKPLIEDLADNGLDINELALYSYAQYAPSRNARIATINPRFPDGGSGMSNADAADILAEFDKAGQTQALEEARKKLLSIRDMTRQLMLDSGLIDQATYDALAAEPDYVPLRGFENVDDAGDLVVGRGLTRGKGFNLRGDETLRALGRKSRAGDIFENVVLDYQRALDRSERNMVAKSFLKFILDNPDPTLWEVDARRTRAAFDRTTGRVVELSEIDKGEHTIGVKVAGRQIYIRIKDPLLVRALKNAHKNEVSPNEARIVRALGLYTNLMKHTLTRWSPEFGMTNATRDATFGATAVLEHLGEKGVAKYAANYAPAMAASHRAFLNKGDPANNEMDRWFKEYQMEGGMTGGFYIPSAAKLNRDLRRMLSDAGKDSTIPGYAVRKMRAMGRALEYFGTVSEQGARVAAYKAAREMGKSKRQAASIAKNSTTNFDRKGELGHTLNSAYVFYNAAVQGGHRYIQMLYSPKVRAYTSGFAAGGVALALANVSWGGTDPEDDIVYWDKIPERDKQRSVVIMLPPGVEYEGAHHVGTNGRYLKLPLQYGMNIPFAVGYGIADFLRNRVDKTRGMSPTKAGAFIASVFAGTFNPIGGAMDITNKSSLLQAVAPTAVDPFVQWTMGTDGFGRPFAPYQNEFDDTPSHRNIGLRDAGSFEEKATDFLNRLGGGDAARASWLDMSPGALRNLESNIGGSTLRFVSDVVNLAGKSVDRISGGDPELFVYEVPFLRRVYGEIDGSDDQRIFYETRRETDKLAGQAKRAVKEGLDPTPREIVAHQVAKPAQEVSRDLAEIRKRMILIKKDDSLSKSEKRLQLRELRRIRDQRVARFNGAFREVMFDFWEDQKL